MVAKQPTTSTVLGLRQTFEAIAPEYLQTHRAPDGTVLQEKGGTIGSYVPGNMPGDSYVDRDKRKNMERLLESHKNFSHKPWSSAMPPTDKIKNGAWDGTFARFHGGWPHMFESLAPGKSQKWLGQIETKMVNPMPVLVTGPKGGGPGFPHRSIASDPTYESEFNYDQLEKLNRQLRLGYGSGFRPGSEKGSRGAGGAGGAGGLGGAGGMGKRPWMTTTVQPGVFDKGGTIFKEQPDGSANMGASTSGTRHLHKYVSRAAALAARANHTAPFISATAERKLPSEVFGSFGYIPEPFVDDTYKEFETMIKTQNAEKGLTSNIHHPPFKCSGKTVTAKATPSVMFRRQR